MRRYWPQWSVAGRVTTYTLSGYHYNIQVMAVLSGPSDSWMPVSLACCCHWPPGNTPSTSWFGSLLLKQPRPGTKIITRRFTDYSIRHFLFLILSIDCLPLFARITCWGAVFRSSSLPAAFVTLKACDSRYASLGPYMETLPRRVHIKTQPDIHYLHWPTVPS
jgi:hypothetical protein